MLKALEYRCANTVALGFPYVRCDEVLAQEVLFLDDVVVNDGDFSSRSMRRFSGTGLAGDKQEPDAATAYDEVLVGNVRRTIIDHGIPLG